MFNDDYGLTQAVLDGRKTMTRRIIKCPETYEGRPVKGLRTTGSKDIRLAVEMLVYNEECDDFVPMYIQPRYEIGEVIAVAQSYESLGMNPEIALNDRDGIGFYTKTKFAPGWNNKLFVRSDLMPHHIRITNIKIERLQGITDDIKLIYVSYAEDGTGTYTYLKNGINNLPISYKKYTGFAASVVGTCNITITQLPSAYEDALVFDGVDDYGICTGLPILDDYTVICRRVLENNVKNVVASKSVVAGNGAFIFEYGNNATYSFSEYTSGLAVNLKDSVSYQTKNSYNGSTITVGNADDTDTLTLGIIREGDSRLLKGAIYYFALYNKSLTPEEVEEEKVKLENYWEGGKNELA